ncbi:MAG: glycosyltransferase, partial [Candidatus Altiarchaeota archaeon]
ILYVGRLEKEKNIEAMLEAFKLLKEKNSKAKLLIVGDGKERASFEEKAVSLGLKDVVFMGAIEHNLIPEIMNASDVFLITSAYESCPLAAEEATACGLPLVSTDVGRVRDFIPPGYGRIISLDRKEIANALEQFLLQKDNPEMRQSCRNKALEFGFDKTAKQTLAVYKNLTNKKGNR